MKKLLQADVSEQNEQTNGERKQVEKPKMHPNSLKNLKMFGPGNQGGAKLKGRKFFSTLFKEAVKELDQKTGDSNSLAIVMKAIDMAKNGDIKAMELVINRVDGKLKEEVDVTQTVVPIPSEMYEAFVTDREREDEEDEEDED